MKKIIMKRMLIFTLLGLFITSVSWGQMDKSKRPSPPATATGKIKRAMITIEYSSPSVKGRKVWGELVPYDKVWRAGANEATIFTTSRDIMVEGKRLAAGKYSLYAIPRKDHWTFIFNSQTGQWGIKQNGETTEDPGKDVVRVDVQAMKSPHFAERLSYDVNKKGFSLNWENLKVPVSIR